MPLPDGPIMHTSSRSADRELELVQHAERAEALRQAAYDDRHLALCDHSATRGRQPKSRCSIRLSIPSSIASMISVKSSVQASTCAMSASWYQ